MNWLIFLALLAPGSAWAYLDPGTGSMILQVVLGGIAAVAVAFKLFWYRIIGFFGFGGKTSDDEDAS